MPSVATSCWPSIPSLFADIQGSTDTEVVFHLALTLGLEDDPIGALERTVGLIEAVASRHGIRDAVQASFGVADGETLWAVRYATADKARVPLRHDGDGHHAQAVSRQPALPAAHDEDRLIVSEPFADLPGVWVEIPESSAVTVRHGGVLEHQAFVPRAPASAVAVDATGAAAG